VVAGGNHTCALTPPGTLFGNAIPTTAKCWGSNLESQLGIGPASAGGPRARNVFAPRDLIQLSTKVNHTCGVRRFGLEVSIVCWGSNFAGQLGFDGANPPIPVSVDVDEILTRTSSSFWTVAAGGGHSCATDSDAAGGTVACWGLNLSGQLGNGTRANSSQPVAVTGLTTALTVATGLNHTCALLRTRQVQCWGQNAFGQLGDGGTADQSTPGNVLAPAPPPPPPPPAPASETISAGSQHTCALVGGGVRCWGFNSSGQLGDGTTTERQSPTVVRDLTDAIQVSAGSTHTCAVRATGRVRCWGSNNRGQLGDGTRTQRTSPVDVTGLTDAIQVSAGGTHTCATRRDGTVRCWGGNFAGAVLGNGSGDAFSAAPVDVLELDGVVQVAAGLDYSCAVRSDTTVRCWGTSRGALGKGADLSDSPLPEPVVDESGEAGTQLSGVTRITAGQFHACALIADGGARCWGLNGDGELGNGSVDPTPAPVPVRDLSGASWIDAGNNHTCAVVAGGAGRCWGSNQDRTLGNGLGPGAPDVLIPAAVSGLTNATQISAGASHTCSRISDGSARCWGSDLWGQLGNGTGAGSGASSRPVPVVGL
jgi:alpha-tubulin suppressor-like RCC1 family protein